MPRELLERTNGGREMEGITNKMSPVNPFWGLHGNKCILLCQKIRGSGRPVPYKRRGDWGKFGDRTVRGEEGVQMPP